MVEIRMERMCLDPQTRKKSFVRFSGRVIRRANERKTLGSGFNGSNSWPIPGFNSMIARPETGQEFGFVLLSPIKTLTPSATFYNLMCIRILMSNQ